MGRSAKEYCRPPQACDGGGLVNMGESESTSEPTLAGKVVKALFQAGVQYATAKELGKGIGKALKKPDPKAPMDGDEDE